MNKYIKQGDDLTILNNLGELADKVDDLEYDMKLFKTEIATVLGSASKNETVKMRKDLRSLASMLHSDSTDHHTYADKIHKSALD